MIDSHCHPDDAAFTADRAAMLERAAAVLEGLVAIDGAASALGLKIWHTAGIHPHEAASAEARWPQIEAAASSGTIIALGEIGLDYHYDHSPRPAQLAAFERQLSLAAAHQLPVSIHTREAWDDTLAVLKNFPQVPGVFHCFTGTQTEADRALALGWYLSFSGLLTFPKLAALRAVAAAAPADRILVETDAPYLAPVPHRGHRNEPAFVLDTARVLASCRHTTVEEIDCVTSANFHRLFPRAR